MNNTLDNFRFFFGPIPEIINSANNLSVETLNMPIFTDIKNDPQLADFRFELDNNPRLIPALLMFYYYERVPPELQPEDLDLEQSISEPARSYIINLTRDLITHERHIRSVMANKIDDPDPNEEVDNENESGIQMRIKPSIPIAEPEPIDARPFEEGRIWQNQIDLDTMPVEAKIIPGERINEEKINDEYLPIANKIKVGGKTKKRRNKYKKATNKKHKKIIRSYKKLKNKKNKKNKKTKNRKTMFR